jgi:polar amino acid transport system permease protein
MSRIPVEDATPEAPTLTEPRQFLDVRPLAKRIIARQSWFIAFLVIDVLILISIRNSPVLQEAWEYIIPGLSTTIQVTILSFIGATILGLIVAFGRISRNVFIYNLSTFYVEIFRGLPLLVIILIFAFALIPAGVDVIAGTADTTDAAGAVVPGAPGIPFLDDLIQRLVGIPEDRIAETKLRTRDIDPLARIVFAFAVTYGAFMSEVFRAGIESIGRGQMEAARSLGMSYWQAMRYIIMPQAIRNVLPAVANNFILLLKDTSLASVVAVPEISHLTRQYASNRFRYPEGLLVLSFLYANLTILLSMGVAWMEHRLNRDRRED